MELRRSNTATSCCAALGTVTGLWTARLQDSKKLGRRPSCAAVKSEGFAFGSACSNGWTDGNFQEIEEQQRVELKSGVFGQLASQMYEELHLLSWNCSYVPSTAKG